MADAIVANYAHHGLSCARIAYRDWATEDEVAATDNDLMELLEDALHPDSEAIVVVCTNVAAARVVAEFERRHKVPVFDSILVTASRSLRYCGLRTTDVAAWGMVAAADLT